MIRINDFWTAFGNFPFVAFRLGVAIQFVRYYEMKTTRFTLALTGLIGEIPPFIVILGMPPTLYLSQLAFPLPFHLLLCAILVYFRPIKRKADVFQEYESLDFYDTAVDSN
jgi:hypothetical protein